jgi:chemotaxis protein CheX
MSSSLGTNVVETGDILESWHAVLELSAKEVFRIMLGCELDNANEPTARTDCDFTAMVGLAGKLCGVLCLRCKAETATLVASRMLGVSPEEILQEQWDAAGEVCNMIAGNFKAKLSGMEDGCMLSVPTVITGADYRLYSLADGGRIDIPLLFENRNIWVSLEIHS